MVIMSCPVYVHMNEWLNEWINERMPSSYCSTLVLSVITKVQKYFLVFCGELVN